MATVLGCDSSWIVDSCSTEVLCGPVSPLWALPSRTPGAGGPLTTGTPSVTRKKQECEFDQSHSIWLREDACRPRHSVWSWPKCSRAHLTQENAHCQPVLRSKWVQWHRYQWVCKSFKLMEDGTEQGNDPTFTKGLWTPGVIHKLLPLILTLLQQHPCDSWVFLFTTKETQG